MTSIERGRHESLVRKVEAVAMKCARFGPKCDELTWVLKEVSRIGTTSADRFRSVQEELDVVLAQLEQTWHQMQAAIDSAEDLGLPVASTGCSALSRGGERDCGVLLVFSCTYLCTPCPTSGHSTD